MARFNFFIDGGEQCLISMLRTEKEVKYFLIRMSFD